MTKLCRYCNIEKPLEDFHVRRASPDGRAYKCKGCKSAYVRATLPATLEYNRQWRQANSDKVRAQKAAAYKRNREQITRRRKEKLELETRWMREGRTCQRCGEPIAVSRDWAAKYCTDLCGERDRSVRAQAIRRARERKAYVADVSLTALGERDNWSCGICGAAVSRASASLDHIVPLSRGGTHEPENCQLAHLHCNKWKGARLMSELPVAPTLKVAA
jgi:RNA polymerase-binding transcription factor DksA